MKNLKFKRYNIGEEFEPTTELRGIYYCSEDIIYLDCTQKINVDNPKTLINALNHCKNSIKEF